MKIMPEEFYDLIREISIDRANRQIRADDLSVPRMQRTLKCGVTQAKRILRELVEKGDYFILDGYTELGKCVKIYRRVNRS